MIDLFKEIAISIPHFAWLTSLSLIVLVGQVFLLRRSLGQRKRYLALEDAARSGDWSRVRAARASLVPTILGALSVFAIPALAVWSLQAARALLFPVTVGGISELQPENVSRGLGGMFNVLPWSTAFLVPSVLLVTVSLSLRLHVYRRTRRLMAISALATDDPDATRSCLDQPQLSADSLSAIPLVFLAFVLFPILAGAWAHALRILQTFGVMASLPAKDKALVLLAGLDRPHTVFAARAWLAYPGMAIAVVVSAVLLIRWRGRAPLSICKPLELSWKATLVLSACCLMGASACFALAEPFRAENAMPWPPPRLNGDTLRLQAPSAPQLEGPDDVERAPLIYEAEQGFALDGRLVAVDEIGDLLATIRYNHHLLHSDEAFSGTFVFVCGANTSIREARPYLLAAARADFDHVLFTFVKHETLDRPILGTLSRNVATAARATLLFDDESADDAASAFDGVILPAKDFVIYEDLARRLVDLRRNDQEVAVQL